MDKHEEEVKSLFRYVLDKLERDEGGEGIVNAKNHRITPNDICLDLQLFAEDIYDGEITEKQKDSIVVTFRNGQSFRISVSAEPIIES